MKTGRYNNIKKSLSMLLLLAFSDTSMYSMEVEQPKTPQIQVFISFVENKTENDLTITIDNKDYVIKAGKTKKLNKNITQLKIPGTQKISHTNIVIIKHNNKEIANIMHYLVKWSNIYIPTTYDFYLFSTSGLSEEERFTIQPDKSYDFSLQLVLEGENLEESTIEVVAVEK